jgi:hypothetical protein
MPGIEVPTLGETPDSEPSDEKRASGRSGKAEADRVKVKKPWGWPKLKKARPKTRERRKRKHRSGLLRGALLPIW